MNDMSKDFNKVSHEQEFRILLERIIIPYIGSLLREWYRAKQMTVKWEQAILDKFSASYGVNQGSLLPPYLFNNIWMNSPTD